MGEKGAQLVRRPACMREELQYKIAEFSDTHVDEQYRIIAADITEAELKSYFASPVGTATAETAETKTMKWRIPRVIVGPNIWSLARADTTTSPQPRLSTFKSPFRKQYAAIHSHQLPELEVHQILYAVCQTLTSTDSVWLGETKYWKTLKRMEVGAMVWTNVTTAKVQQSQPDLATLIACSPLGTVLGPTFARLVMTLPPSYTFMSYLHTEVDDFLNALIPAEEDKEKKRKRMTRTIENLRADVTERIHELMRQVRMWYQLSEEERKQRWEDERYVRDRLLMTIRYKPLRDYMAAAGLQLSWVMSVGQLLDAWPIIAYVDILGPLDVTELNRCQNSTDLYASFECIMWQLETRARDLTAIMLRIQATDDQTFNVKVPVLARRYRAQLANFLAQPHRYTHRIVNAQASAFENYNDYINFVQDFNRRYRNLTVSTWREVKAARGDFVMRVTNEPTDEERDGRVRRYPRDASAPQTRVAIDAAAWEASDMAYVGESMCHQFQYCRRSGYCDLDVDIASLRVNGWWTSLSANDRHFLLQDGTAPIGNTIELPSAVNLTIKLEPTEEQRSEYIARETMTVLPYLRRGRLTNYDIVPAPGTSACIPNIDTSRFHLFPALPMPPNWQPHIVSDLYDVFPLPPVLDLTIPLDSGICDIVTERTSFDPEDQLAIERKERDVNRKMWADKRFKLEGGSGSKVSSVAEVVKKQKARDASASTRQAIMRYAIMKEEEKKEERMRVLADIQASVDKDSSELARFMLINQKRVTKESARLCAVMKYYYHTAVKSGQWQCVPPPEEVVKQDMSYTTKAPPQRFFTRKEWLAFPHAPIRSPSPPSVRENGKDIPWKARPEGIQATGNVPQFVFMMADDADDDVAAQMEEDRATALGGARKAKEARETDTVDLTESPPPQGMLRDVRRSMTDIDSTVVARQPESADVKARAEKPSRRPSRSRSKTPAGSRTRQASRHNDANNDSAQPSSRHHHARAEARAPPSQREQGNTDDESAVVPNHVSSSGTRRSGGGSACAGSSTTSS